MRTWVYRESYCCPNTPWHVTRPGSFRIFRTWAEAIAYALTTQEQTP